MPNTMLPKEGNLLTKAVDLLKQFPWVAFCLFMAYRDINRENTIAEKETAQIKRDIERETFYRSQLLFWRQKVEEERDEKETKLLKDEAPK